MSKRNEKRRISGEAARGRAAPTMLDLIAALPGQIRASADLLAGLSLPRIDPARGVVVCGMGGSAAAADLLQACTLREGPRVDVVRGYALPGHVDPGALLVFSSYSGHTEETLSAYDHAAADFPSAPRLVITSGGELAARAARDGVPCLGLPGELPPRASLGFGLGALVRALDASGVLPRGEADLEVAAERLEEGDVLFGPARSASENPLRMLARRLRGRMAVIYASRGPAGAAAGRWRAQINENAKALALTADLPELDHNEVVGWQTQTRVRPHLVVVALRDPDEHPRVRARFEITREVLGSLVPHWESVWAGEGPPLARALDLVQRGDLLSVYLAEEHGADPTPVAVIDEIKARLERPA